MGDVRARSRGLAASKRAARAVCACGAPAVCRVRVLGEAEERRACRACAEGAARALRRPGERADALQQVEEVGRAD